MFSNLLASAPQKRSLASPAWLVSTGLHVLAVAGMVWATGVGRDAAPRNDRVMYVEVTRPMEPPAPEVEAPPEPEEPKAAEPEPQTPPPPPDELPIGFQTLAVPEIVAGIPEPGRVEIRAEDFSGVGIAGGIAGGRPIVPSDTARPAPAAPAPVSVAVVDQRPRVKNLGSLASRMQELYPPHYRMAGIEGEVLVQLVVDTEGRVERDGVSVVSGSHEGFEAPTRRLVEDLRWEPARRNGKPVRVWVRLPVSWTID